MEEVEKIMSDFRVGLVTFLALVFLIAGITYAGGDKGILFQRTMEVRALVNDVGGLKKGAAVTMGGMNIGKVTKLGFVEDQGERIIEVGMHVRAQAVGRMRSDSVPAVRTQGMLGDRYIEISAGTADAPPLEPGQALIGNEASDFDDTLREARDMLVEAQAALIETTKFLDAINDRQGTMGEFVYDKAFYEKLTATTTEINDLVRDFKKNPRRYIKFSVF